MEIKIKIEYIGNKETFVVRNKEDFKNCLKWLKVRYKDLKSK